MTNKELVLLHLKPILMSINTSITKVGYKRVINAYNGYTSKEYVIMLDRYVHEYIIDITGLDLKSVISSTIRRVV